MIEPSAIPGFALTATGLSATGEPSRPSWAEFGATLAYRGSVNAWALGDWISLGERSWGDVYAEAAEITGHDRGYLRILRHVCRRFDSLRRRNTLTFGHHQAVCSLLPARADALLDQAEREKLSVPALRLLVSGRPDRDRLVTVEPDPVTQYLTQALRGVTALREALEQIQASQHAARLNRHLVQHHIDVAALIAALNEFAAEGAMGFEDDAAEPEEMAVGAYGRRVG
jgi:hypothetical protein